MLSIARCVENASTHLFCRLNQSATSMGQQQAWVVPIVLQNAIRSKTCTTCESPCFFSDLILLRQAEVVQKSVPLAYLKQVVQNLQPCRSNNPPAANMAQQMRYSTILGRVCFTKSEFPVQSFRCGNLSKTRQRPSGNFSDLCVTL